MSAHERFLKKVLSTKTCWIWEGSKHTDGYGLFTVNGKRLRAHRYSYEYFKGNIPEKLVIDHLCRNRACVNPIHLELVSIRENIMRGEGLSAQNARKTRCKRGHDFNEENTILVYKKTHRERWCRVCQKAKDIARYHRKKKAVMSYDIEANVA